MAQFAVGRCKSKKRAFDSRAEAKTLVRKLKLLEGGLNGLRAYKCDECGWWHVGHSRRRA